MSRSLKVEAILENATGVDSQRRGGGREGALIKEGFPKYHYGGIVPKKRARKIY